MEKTEVVLFEGKNLRFNEQLYYGNFTIPAGKVNFIIGESGSGKSTLLKLLNKTISPCEGSLYYKGKSYTEYDAAILRKEVSLVSQEVFLFDETVLENFKHFYQLRQLPLPSQAYLEKIAEICCVTVPFDQKVTTLSGGERQRVYTAIFLSFKPHVLLLDEPTSALDEQTSLTFIGNIINFCKENDITLLVISHNANLVTTFEEAKFYIKKGASVCRG